MQRGFQGSEDQQRERIQNWISNAFCSSAGGTEFIREQPPLSSGDNRVQDVELFHTVIGNVNIGASHNLDDESSWGYQNYDNGHDVPLLADDDTPSESASRKSNESDWSNGNDRAHDEPALRDDDYFSELTSVGSDQGELGGQNGEDNGDGPALGDDDNASESTSIPPDLELSWKENGRSYHRYFMDEFYPFPEDVQAQDNQEDQHDFLYDVLGGKTHVAPVDWGAAKKVLDAGTGTGCWAIDIADKNPSIQVVGVDLSSIVPDWVPPNTKFYIDNIDEYIMGDGYDYIFARSIEIKAWPVFMRRAYDNLKEGGWLEIQNPVFIPRGELAENSKIKECTEYMEEAMKRSGRSTASALLYKQKMEAAGYTNVQEEIYELPVNARSPILKDLEGLLLALFTRYLSWKPSMVYVFAAEVRQEIQEIGDAHVFFNLSVNTLLLATMLD
ncbi:hypothetical protein NLG97_g3171 [Lecanicillium saksenae]|uniref:Uncharacterized protein n=1 Tax=Lecanicillium saksenae TaxID=468837 RepID=A0ACC1R090_9HYPO|nr:hypothetical protein NLG97_g3171 [Lecanicillium saksenae]